MTVRIRWPDGHVAEWDARYHEAYLAKCSGGPHARRRMALVHRQNVLRKAVLEATGVDIQRA